MTFKKTLMNINKSPRRIKRDAGGRKKNPVAKILRTPKFKPFAVPTLLLFLADVATSEVGYFHFHFHFDFYFHFHFHSPTHFYLNISYHSLKSFGIIKPLTDIMIQSLKRAK